MPKFLVVKHDQGYIPPYVIASLVEAEDGEDATGQAAIENRYNGTYVAFPVESSTTRTVEIVKQAVQTETPFPE